MPLSSQTELEEALDGVAGWFVPSEAWVLHEAIQGIAPERPITVVEIGSSRGRSTIVAGHALLGRAEGGILYAIDPQGDDAFQELRANLSDAGVESVVRLIRATSRDARKQFGEEPLDLVFIDGSHEYEDVRDDFADWLPLVKAGGVVAVNDPFWWGVAKALRERLAVGGPLRSPRFAHNTIFFSYRPDADWTPQDGRELMRLRASLVIGRIGGSLLAVTGAASVLPVRVRGLLLRAIGRMVTRLLAWVLPAAEA
jgi:predicted O-methyltransferase YrrM